MQDTSIQEPLTEKKCPLCGRGLARTYGPEIPCTLCVRLGPPAVRRCPDRPLSPWKGEHNQ